MISFNQALARAADYIRTNRGDLGTDAVLLRDVFGRLAMVIPPVSSRRRKELATAFRERVGPWARDGMSAVLATTDIGLDLPTHDPDRALADDRVDDPVWMIERMVTGRDWTLPPLPDAPPTVPRAVLYGVKGGVGRSTALGLWAILLAREHGKRVLVADLDLESPGIGTTLLDPDLHPDLGFVDCILEGSVGQLTPAVASAVAAARPNLDLGTGEIHVLPSSGRTGGQYPQKLARITTDVPSSGHTGDVVSPAARLAEVLDEAERQWEPDVVLIDSRSGLHDIAATALVRLRAELLLLFAVGTRQTWSGYRLLFEHWRRWAASGINRSAFDDLRDSLRLVASQVPETRSGEYLAALRQDAYDLFASTLYESTDGTGDPFHPEPDDEDAPHAPIRIDWNRRFMTWDPEDPSIEGRHVDASFGQFLETATELLGIGEVT